MTCSRDLEIAASRTENSYLANLLWWAIAEIRKLRKQLREAKGQ